MPKKKSLHKNYREITVIMTDGTEFKTRSAYSGDVLKLDVDVLSHPAWTQKTGVANQSTRQVAGFRERFKGFTPDFSMIKNKAKDFGEKKTEESDNEGQEK